jgi:ribosome-associated protein
MDIKKLQRAIVDGLEDLKAQQIVVFDTEHLSPLFERVIIATGTSNRQTRALAASVRDAVKSKGFPIPRVEGEDNGEWIIVDCNAAVVHLMQQNIRDYYNLEELWGDKPVKMKKDAAPTKLVKASSSEASPKGKAKVAVKSSAGSQTKALTLAGPTKKVTAKKTTSKVTSATGAVAKKAVAKKAVKVSSASTAQPKSAAAKKVAIGKGGISRTVGVKAAAKKVAVKTAAVKKVAAKKVAAKETVAQKVIVKKVVAKKAVAKKVAAKKVAVKKVAVKKVAVKKAASKKVAAKKVAVKKVAVKKAGRSG